MGRPSELRVALDVERTEASAVLVSGDAVVVGAGELEIPSADPDSRWWAQVAVGTLALRVPLDIART